jgi:hypothetical protein
MQMLLPMPYCEKVKNIFPSLINKPKLVFNYQYRVMGIVVRISKKSKPEETRKALDKLAGRRKKRSKKRLSDFYGKMKGTYGDGLDYQKKIRDEWS